MRSVDQGRPGWEQALNVPYQIIAIPFRIVGFLVGQTIVLVDRTHVVQATRDLLEIESLPVETRLIPVAGGRDGFGLRLSMRDRRPVGPGGSFRFDATVTTRARRDVLLSGLWQFERSTLEFAGKYFKNGSARFYGIGPQSLKENESFYTREGSWVGTALHRRIFGNIFTTGTLLFNQIVTRGTSVPNEPNLDDVFPPDQRPPGFGTLSQGVHVALTLARNSAPGLGRPDRGAFSRATVHFFESTSADDTRYWGYRLDVQRFLPLWFTKRSLATRASVHRLVSQGDDPIPLAHLLQNEMPDLLRGYVDGRWTDVGILNLTAEYRWPVWNNSRIDDMGIDAYLFVDYGQVFSETSEISTRNMTTSYGLGFRIIDDARFFVRLEVAHSKEDTLFRLSADQIFQFTQSGFSYGRAPD
jgi:outer membrane protein assembly factor BamA